MTTYNDLLSTELVTNNRLYMSGIIDTNLRSQQHTLLSGWITLQGGSIPATGSGTSYDSTNAPTILIPAETGKSLYITKARTWMNRDTSTDYSVNVAIFDKYVATSGLFWSVTTAQTVNSVALPSRATGGNDVLLLIQTWATGASGQNPSLSISYTNQFGINGRTATIPAMGSDKIEGLNCTIIAALEGNDTGVRSVETVTVTSGGSTPGNFGIILAKPLTFFCAASGAFSGERPQRDLIEIGLPKLDNDTVLSIYTATVNGSNTDPVEVLLEIIQI